MKRMKDILIHGFKLFPSNPHEILMHPLVILASMIGGVILGLNNPALAKKISPFGELFLSLMKMCVLPIMVTMIVLGISRMLKDKHAGRLLGALVAVCAFSSALTGALGIAAGYFIKNFLINNQNTAEILSKLLKASSVGMGLESLSMKKFLFSIVPQNIFHALVEGQFLPLLFFFILFGVALGHGNNESDAVVMSTIDGIKSAFFRLIRWFTYLMPLALFSIFAETFSKYGVDTLYALGGIIISCHIALLALILLYLLIVLMLYGRKTLAMASLHKDALMVALGTTSSLAAMPFALQALEEGFKLEKQKVELIFPLCAMFNVHVHTFFISLIVFLVCGVYGVHVGPHQAMIIIGGSIAHGLCSTGMPAIATIAMLTIVFSPLGIPVEAAAVLFTVLLPIMDPLLTATIVSSNSTATLLIARVSQEA